MFMNAINQLGYVFWNYILLLIPKQKLDIVYARPK